MKKKPLIAIIDDSLIVQSLIEFTLHRDLKCEVSKYTTAEAALNELKEVTPDLILLDYALDSENKSAENGLTFLKKMKEMGKKIPTIIFSGQTDKKIAINLLQEGAVDYVSKNSIGFLEKLAQSVEKTLTMAQLKIKFDTHRNKKMGFLKKILLIAGIPISTIIITLIILIA